MAQEQALGDALGGDHGEKLAGPGALAVGEHPLHQGVAGAAAAVLRQHPHLGDDALARTNVAGGEPDGLLLVLGGLKAVRIVGDEVGEIGVELHVEVENPAVPGKAASSAATASRSTASPGSSSRLVRRTLIFATEPPDPPKLSGV